MTAEESTMTEAQRILDGAECPRCCDYGAITIQYDPGCLWIECSRCRRSIALPDYDPKTALLKWAETD